MAMAGLAFYALLMPWYAADSGGLQPCDAALALLAGALWWKRWVPGPSISGDPLARFRRSVVLLVLWCLLVNATWYLFTGAQDLLSAGLALVHALIAVSLITDAWGQLGPERFLRSGACGMLGALFWTSAMLPMEMLYLNQRHDGAFNNPNQLGYFAICAICVIALARHQRAIAWWMYATGLALGALLITASASKAAICAGVVLAVFEFPRAPRTIVSFALVGYLAALLALHHGSSLDSQAMRRMSQLGSARYDSLDGRGYPRIWENPQLLPLGAGDGAFGRFPSTSGEVREIHGTAGNFLMSYGLVGVFLAFLVFAAAIRNAPLLGISALLPLAIYGLSHNGIRFRAAWLVLAIVACVCAASGRAKTDVKSTA